MFVADVVAHITVHAALPSRAELAQMLAEFALGLAVVGLELLGH